MTSFKTIERAIVEKVAAWRRYRKTIRELSQMSDLELHDIGVHRGEIEHIASTTARAA
jgi:uncharacterized protein YjiS (DUF1127 family)